MVKNIPVGEVIVRFLKESKTPLSTYEIAKKASISWSTANTHCYKLKDEGIIDGKLEMADVGASKKMLWWIIK
ncbi:HTH domain-containing protein [archaeon]|nr:HTH domain-containing protein [archaeon]